MSVGARLGAFVLVLLGTFGTAYAVGERLPGHEHQDAHAHTGDTSGLALPSDEQGGHRLVTDDVAQGGDGARLATFHMEMSDGMAVTGFDEAHGARLHVVAVRPDLSGFQHLHPDIADDGSWQVNLVEPGPWHLVMEGVPAGTGSAVVVSTDLDDGTPFEAAPLPETADQVTVDGLHVKRAGLNFVVTAADGGAADGLEPYLGQPAHLVALREDDLAFTHLHPTDEMAGMFAFGSSLPEPGTYRLFLQFGHDGRVLTVPFTVVQDDGAATTVSS